jgi:hypothetical protein
MLLPKQAILIFSWAVAIKKFTDSARSKIYSFIIGYLLQLIDIYGAPDPKNNGEVI